MSDKREDLKSLFNSLTSLARKMKELMGDDDYILLRKAKSMAALEIIDEDRKKKQDIKLKVKNFVETLDKTEFKQTRYRHHFSGRPNPPIERILKGKRLWRAIAMGYIGIVIRPNIIITKVRKAARDRECQDFTNTIEVYSESSDIWLTKLVRIPLTSIIQVHKCHLCVHYAYFL